MKKCFACLLFSACLFNAQTYGQDTADGVVRAVEDITGYEESATNDSAFYFGLGIGYDHVSDKLNLEHVAITAPAFFNDCHLDCSFGKLSKGRIFGNVGLGTCIQCPGDFFAALEFWASLGKNVNNEFKEKVVLNGTNFNYEGKLKRKGFEPYLGLLFGYFFRSFGMGVYATIGGTLIKSEYDANLKVIGYADDMACHRSFTSISPTVGFGIAKRICNFDLRFEGKFLLNASKKSDFSDNLPGNIKIDSHLNTDSKSWKICAYAIYNIKF